MEPKKPYNLFLYFAVISLNLSSFTAGTMFAWSSPAIPKLNGQVDPQDNPLYPPLDINQASWVTSLVALGAVISPFFAAICSDKYGRKKTLLTFMAPIVPMILVCAFAEHVYLLYLYRFVSGFCIGSVFTVLPMYVGEICTKSNRGALSCYLVIMIALGNLLTYCIGPYVSIMVHSLVTLVPAVGFLVLVGFFVPESPYFLAAQDRNVEALDSLAIYRRMPANCVEKELQEITDIVQESFVNKSNILDIFRNKILLKSLMIVLALMTFQQFSGINNILLFLQTIFELAGGDDNDDDEGLSPEIGSIIIGITQFVAANITSSFVDRLGRRYLIIISCIGSALSITVLGVFFYLLENEYDTQSISLLPVISLIAFMLAYTFGLGPIPFTILGEIFPPNAKAAASTLSVSLCFLYMYINTMCFSYMLEAIGNAASFWFYGAFSYVAIAYFYFLLPETKGKSLQEIQNMLKGSNSVTR